MCSNILYGQMPNCSEKQNNFLITWLIFWSFILDLSITVPPNVFLGVKFTIFASFHAPHRVFGRQNLDPNNYDIYVEMEFYSFLIERFIEWMYGAIKESNMASIWKILVAYQKIVTVMEHIGIERALGTVRKIE